jgi:hypothetical protein
MPSLKRYARRILIREDKNEGERLIYTSDFRIRFYSQMHQGIRSNLEKMVINQINSNGLSRLRQNPVVIAPCWMKYLLTQLIVKSQLKIGRVNAA